eukprot:428187_1
MATAKQHPMTAYMSVAGGFITLMAVGSVQMTFGNILPYIASYMASKDENSEENYNYYTDQGTWIYVARATFFVFGSILGAKLAQHFGGRIAILIGDIILSVSVGISYFIVFSLEAMIFIYGGVAAIGCGISYIIPLAIAAKWFPNNKAFVSGIILSGYGLSGVIFTFVFTAIINPDNVPLDSKTGFLNKNDVLNRVPAAFWKMAIICLSMQLFALIFIKEAPNNNTENITKYTDEIDCIDMTKIIEQNKKSIENEQTKLLDANMIIVTGNYNKCVCCTCCNIDKYLKKFDLLVLKEPIFLNLLITLFFSQMTTVIFSTVWKTLTNQRLGIENDWYLSFIGSLSSFTNALGRIFWGYVNDNNSYIVTMAIMTLFDCILLGTWSHLNTFFVVDRVLETFAAIWLGGIFFFQIGIYNIMVKQIGEIYGVDKINYYYALLMTNQIPSGIFSALAVTQMRQVFGWDWLTFTMAVFQFIAFCIVMTSKWCRQSELNKTAITSM